MYIQISAWCSILLMILYRNTMSIFMQVRCPTTSMVQVVDMIGRLSPLARIEERHPTLVKFSIPACRHTKPSSTEELSLAAAFETIESRKEELHVSVDEIWRRGRSLIIPSKFLVVRCAKHS